MTDDHLQQAIEAIQAGDKQRGRELIAATLKQDRNNEQAWLWLTQTDISKDQKIKSLQNVLKINPNNEQAKTGLAQLQGQALQFDDLPEPTPSPKKKKRPVKLALPLIVAILLVCGCLIVWGSQQSSPASLAATPTPSGPTPTIGPTPLKHEGSMAIRMCRNFVKEKLVSPTSAEFSNEEAFGIPNEPRNFHAVTGAVDSQNRLGVMLRSTYQCEIHYVPEDPNRWILDNLVINE